MSSEAYARQTVRERKIWVPYQFSFPFDTGEIVERNLIYGIYSGAYLNGQAYLVEVEATELGNLLTNYNSKIAALSADEQIYVADIVSKRYLASIDVIIHDQKMVTKQQEIGYQDALWDAKIAALAVDQAALVTMATMVSSEILKTNARITEIQAYIAIEGYNLSEVDVQIAEKQIQSERITIEQLNVANEILRIQLQIIEASMKLIDIDVRIAKNKVAIADTERDIARTELLPIELEIEQTRTSMAEAEIPVAEARVNLAQSKIDAVEAELNYVETTLMTQEGTRYQDRIDLLDLKKTSRENELSKSLQEKELQIDNREALSTFEVNQSIANIALQAGYDMQRVLAIQNRHVIRFAEAAAAITIAQELAEAKVVTELTHLISKA